MSQEKRAQFEQKYMINAQRGQAVQRANYNMPYMQNYRVIQPMPMYQQFPQMGYSPFSSGFGFNNYRVVPGLPITPPLPYQPYVQQPRPMMAPPPVYPSPGVMMPPQPVYAAQPLYRAQNNPINQQGKAIVYSTKQQQQPVYQNNVQVIHTNNNNINIQRNPYQQPQPQIIQMNSPFNPTLNN